MILNADMHWRDVTFKVGGFISVEVQVGRKQTRTMDFEPNDIIWRIREIGFRLAVPDEAQIHLVFLTT